MNAPSAGFRKLGKQALSFALALGIWFAPIPAGLTGEAWHLFAVFAAAIFSVIVNAFPLLTASLLAVGAVVLTGTVDPAKAFAGFANSSVLLVVVAFLVANAVVKAGLGRRISLLVVSAFGRSALGLGYSIFLTDALIAPAFPSNTARGGVLYPIILSLAQSAGSRPEDADKRRMGGYLMFCGMASLSVSSALWLTATSANPIGVSLAAQSGLKITFGTWLLAASVPALATILMLPAIISRLFPPGVSGHARCARDGTQGVAQHGAAHSRRVDRRGDLCGHGDRMGDGGQPPPKSHCGGLRRPRRAPRNQRPDARGHQPAGQHLGHLPLARGAFRVERPAE